MKKIPDRKIMIQKLKICLKRGNYLYTQIDYFYNHIMIRIADQTVVSGNNFKVEQRRLE